MHANSFRYGGQYYDKETSTYYLRARYYDPVIGRFTREDPHWNTGNMIYGDDPVELASGAYAPNIAAIVQSGNRYPYAMNNPVKYVDENGEIVVPAWLIGIGIKTAKDALIDGIITGGVYYFSNGESFWAGFTNGAISGAFSGFGEATGGYVGKAIGSAIGSGFGTYIEEIYINKETDDFAKASAVQAAVSGALSVIPSKYWGEVRKAAIEFDIAASGLMEYNDKFGELLGDILDGLVTAIGAEEH